MTRGTLQVHLTLTAKQAKEAEKAAKKLGMDAYVS